MGCVAVVIGVDPFKSDIFLFTITLLERIRQVRDCDWLKAQSTTIILRYNSQSKKMTLFP